MEKRKLSKKYLQIQSLRNNRGLFIIQKGVCMMENKLGTIEVKTDELKITCNSLKVNGTKIEGK